MTVGLYTRIHERLQHPLARVFSAADLIEQLHPHTPPDDEADDDTAWQPEFTSSGDVLRTIDRLKRPSRVIAGLTAVELAMPVFEEWAAANGLSEHHRRLPAISTGLVYGWLAGDEVDAEAIEPFTEFEFTMQAIAKRRFGARWDPGIFMTGTGYRMAVAVTALLRCTAVGAGRAITSAMWVAINGVEDADTQFVPEAGPTMDRQVRFLREMWRRLRCRLATARPTEDWLRA
ncbi:MAG: hypothetical protein AB7K09_03175 [Planctomycetota bacterium]